MGLKALIELTCESKSLSVSKKRDVKYDVRYYVNAIIEIDCLVLHYPCIPVWTKFLLLQMAG